MCTNVEVCLRVPEYDWLGLNMLCRYDWVCFQMFLVVSPNMFSHWLSNMLNCAFQYVQRWPNCQICLSMCPQTCVQIWYASERAFKHAFKYAFKTASKSNLKCSWRCGFKPAFEYAYWRLMVPPLTVWSSTNCSMVPRENYENTYICAQNQCFQNRNPVYPGLQT